MSDNINVSSNPTYVTVYLDGYGDRRFKQWTKMVISVDTTKSNGYAFEGKFLTLGRKHRLPVGAIVLFYGRFGSVKYNSPAVKVCRVQLDGLETVFERKRLDESWALEVMDDIVALLK